MALPPIIWKPSPKYSKGRFGQPVRGWVMHRIVGTLASADAVFLTGTRSASSHFGIGHINGQLRIHQYVDLSDTAWTNGDARDPTWSVTRSLPGVNANSYTVTTEHEDGGYVGRGVVQPDTWQASMALTRLCVSGDIAAIRNAGIRVRDDVTVAQMAVIPRTVHGYVDHHQIAGPNKPYCWRRWLDDPGFVDGSPSRRDQILTYLGPFPDTALPGEDDMPKIVERITGKELQVPSGTEFRKAPGFGTQPYYTSPVAMRVQPFGVVEGDAYKVSATMTSKRWHTYVTSDLELGYLPAVIGDLVNVGGDSAGEIQAAVDPLYARIDNLKIISREANQRIQNG